VRRRVGKGDPRAASGHAGGARRDGGTATAELDVEVVEIRREQGPHHLADDGAGATDERFGDADGDDGRR
jgi:hypothetical protein